MPILRDGKPFVIYALVCPLSLEVKYVGQTVDLEQRTRGKTHNTRGHTRLTEWLQTLGYLRPYKVILEKGINRRVELPAPPRLGRGRRPLESVWLSSCLEAKWIKRFRRTILNKNMRATIAASALLTNPPLPWESGPKIGR